jgi:diaminohydroxyphosphoribosylaminopyrimidine deaminase/5-amino-6-(5-phosphoribosylamino)uracil reductase
LHATEIDEKFMKEAIRQGGKGLGRTSPNPPVGAVIVRNGRIIATGYHQRAGGPHAEVVALQKIGGKARRGDILYVTLEPCNHYGRTPPCTESILKSGLRRVVVGLKDPNPNVQGGGCEFLVERGIEVITGVLEPECRRFAEVFIKYATTGRPFVAAKSALTMDGWTATSRGHSQWITSEQSRRYVHRLREQTDAIMVGVGTVLADDPSLNVRLRNRRGKDPVRVIVDTHLRVSPQAKVLRSNSSDSMTLIALGSRVPARRVRMFEREGITTLVCPEKGGRVDLASLMERLGGMSITSVLVEGGATLMGSIIRQRLVDKFYIFKAPKILGGSDGFPMASGPGPKRIDQCLKLKDLKVRRFGADILLTGYPDYD